jgi:hypothetical protein
VLDISVRSLPIGLNTPEAHEPSGRGLSRAAALQRTIKPPFGARFESKIDDVPA